MKIANVMTAKYKVFYIRQCCLVVCGVQNADLQVALYIHLCLKVNKKLRYRRNTTQCSMLLEVLLSHSR